ncbi:MAG: DUF1223 domain-containing protein [Alphaproteobacteria bacterium]|nr:DUF1223 domain-containing protein [Alphaproteobacteria bacterium]NCQ89026.1 DUF1223 domain-containing protein [Alphaproteobacteria bacterium]NCT07927.1 DUF1223 domain-containing protein [Alphaproteobacteria bacterium]
MFLIMLGACLALLSNAAANDSAPQKPPVVVELFTSEFCPACPPADQYLAKLSNEANMITLGCHVTYFQGRSDLGRPFCSQRQFDYMRQLRGKSPFTPQFVINGHRSVVGTRQSEVAASLLKAQSADTQYINIYPKAHGVYGYELPLIPLGQYTLFMALYQTEQTVRGRQYASAVDLILNLGDWDGVSDARVFFPAVRDNHAGFAIFAKELKSGKIMAAGKYHFGA